MRIRWYSGNGPQGLFNHKTTEPAISHSNNISYPRIIVNGDTAVVIKMVSVLSIENIVLLYSVIE